MNSLNNQEHGKLPLNNFFGDDFLSLVWTSDKLPNAALKELKKHLKIVANESNNDIKRSYAAIEIGDFVDSSDNKNFLWKRSDGKSSKTDWFNLALKLGNPIGAWKAAEDLLLEQGLAIKLDLCNRLVPILAKEEGKKGRSGLSESAANMWLKAIFISNRSIQNQLADWNLEMVRHAINCVVCYLSLLPSSLRKNADNYMNDRQQELLWIRQIWDALIEAECKQTEHNKDLYQQRLDQQFAVLAIYKNIAPLNLESIQIKSGPNLADARKIKFTVISGEITPSTEKSDMDSLKRFESLRQPIPLVPMPTLESLNEIKDTLCSEFPWASKVIDQILGHLIAKKRHGVLELSLQPYLLIGEPGTGKTRFSNRLAELLGTSSLVINLAAMSDPKLLKGSTRGWASARPSIIIERIQHDQIANPLFILDEIDKTAKNTNNGDPDFVLMDLIEKNNSRRFLDLFLLTECNLSACMYIATSNSIENIPKPLLSRFQLIYFPKPTDEYANTIAINVLRDIEKEWQLPANTINLPDHQISLLKGLSPREIRFAINEMIATNSSNQRLH